MKKFISYPKIGQFKNVIRHVVDSCRYAGKDDNGDAIFDPTIIPPTLKFKGSVKLHGTNAGVSINREGEIWAQSRTSIITSESDNAGFAFFVESNVELFRELFSTLSFEDADFITIFGEWCGGNIQKGVAINGLDKMFVVFATKLSYIDEERSNWYLTDEKYSHLSSNEDRIYNINDFETYEIEIDFSDPARSQNEIIELTMEIEKECPIGKKFGNIGIGEGVVFKHVEENGSIIQFKSKGKKHSSSKVKTLAPIDTEKMASIDEFVEYSVTENRLNQAIEQVFTINNEEIDIKKMGQFLKWVSSDIITEEKDTMKESGLEPRDIGKHLSNKARKWFLEKWNTI